MSRFIITEEEKKHIKGLYEQEDMSQQTQMVTNDFKSGPAVYYGKEITLKELEKQGKDDIWVLARKKSSLRV